MNNKKISLVGQVFDPFSLPSQSEQPEIPPNDPAFLDDNIARNFADFDLLDPDPTSEPEVEPEPKNKLHLAFLFASPLVTSSKDGANLRLKSMPILEYRREIEKIISNAGSFKQGISYRTCVATLDNLQQCIQDMPIALHFTGHGLTSAAFDRTKSDEGDYLVFEDENGKAQYISSKTLAKLLNSCPRQPEIVFVSSCHSRLVGEVFRDAGARHVICVSRSETILDDVAVLFAQEFYKAFFSPKGTVREAFELARTKVKTKTAEHISQIPFVMTGKEHEKFELLMNNNLFEFQDSRDACSVPDGLPQNIAAEITYSEIPPGIEYFVGRECELYQIICLVRKSRLVTIKGLTGIGKTSIAKALANFFMERSVFRDGIIYLAAKGIKSEDALETQLSIATKCTFDPRKTRLGNILSTLEEKEVLIIIDNAENVINNDRDRFLGLIHRILGDLPKVKALITSRTHLRSVSDLTEKVYNLLPLDPKSAVHLLERRSPRQIDPDEVKGLFYNKEESKDLNNGNLNVKDHRLMQILSGHPQAISLTAASLQGRTLKEIYQEIKLEPLKVKGMEELIAGLSSTIAHIETSNPASVKFFKMMGLFPCGASTREMKAIWGSNYNDHAMTLQYVSLLVRQGSTDTQEDRYWLLPLVANYGLNCLQKYDINDVLERGYRFYGNALETVFMAGVDLHGWTLKDEGNIMAFISYGSGKKVIDDEILRIPALESGYKRVRDLFIGSDSKELVPTRSVLELLDGEADRAGPLTNAELETLDVKQPTRRKSFFDKRKIEEAKTRRRNSEDVRSINFDVFIEKVMSQSEDESGIINQYNDLLTRENSMGLKEGMTGYGRLLVYYCGVLFLAKRYKDVKKLIEIYVDCPKLKEDRLAQANLYKLIGLTTGKLQKENKDHKEERRYYDLANNLFAKINSYLGQAACLLALGNTDNNQLTIHYSYEKALNFYNLLKHEYGASFCSKKLAQLKGQELSEQVNNGLELKKDSIINQRLLKRYTGGRFINRSKEVINDLIIEIARVHIGTIFLSSLELTDSRKTGFRPPINKGDGLHTKADKYKNIEDALKGKKGMPKKQPSVPFNLNEEEKSPSQRIPKTLGMASVLPSTEQNKREYNIAGSRTISTSQAETQDDMKESSNNE